MSYSGSYKTKTKVNITEGLGQVGSQYLLKTNSFPAYTRHPRDSFNSSGTVAVAIFIKRYNDGFMLTIILQ